MPVYILGISAYYHDSAAALLQDGRILAAVQEERFSRRKHDAGFPRQAVSYCLQAAGISLTEVDFLIYSEKPFIKFERLIETYLSCAPRGGRSFIMAMPVWLKEKLYLKRLLRKELSAVGGIAESLTPPLLFSEHHQSHAASAFFPSPFQKAAVLCMDGVGEWATTSAWLGDGNALTAQWQVDFPHSLGLLYSAFTYFCGFRVNSGEYKLMGLAPYGEPRYVQTILDNLIDIKEDGTFRLNLKYFNFPVGLTMTNRHFEALFGGPPRKPESPLTRREMDMARSIQEVTEEIVLRLARAVYKDFGTEALCLAGGVALNCVANGRLLREGPFRDIWIQPAAGDAGSAVGAALAVWHQYLQQPRQASGYDEMQGSYLGPLYSAAEIRGYLDSMQALYREMTEDGLYEEVAKLLAQEKVIGWFQGRMEFGPRALGNRSILGDARSVKMQSMMNLKIKYRESFRPFAPSVIEEDVLDYFERGVISPYMLLTDTVKPALRIPMTATQEGLFGLDKLNVPRSAIPAVTHVDYTARVQTVNRTTNSKLYGLLKAFKAETGCGVLVNTSFNVRGEPIVCSPEDAYRCFMRTDMDYLVMEGILLDKRHQPSWDERGGWKQEFTQD
ncbi:MAG: carbamoyltransferase [Nitrospirae bacterium]|nr:carbamoyltransferase [Nitrospirota bacterium]